MSVEDRNKWNKRYAEDNYRKSNPVTLLQDWLPKLPQGKALDVACGSGRNAVFMANSGFQVDAIDISHQGLSLARQQAENHNLTINWIEHDLDEGYAFNRDYDLIVVMWFVNLKLITRLCDCLVPGGYLLCEEHLVTDVVVTGPSSAKFRVAPGALRDAVTALEIEFYRESIQQTDEGESLASAQLVARKPVF